MLIKCVKLLFVNDFVCDREMLEDQILGRSSLLLGRGQKDLGPCLRGGKVCFGLGCFSLQQVGGACWICLGSLEHLLL